MSIGREQVTKHGEGWAVMVQGRIQRWQREKGKR